MEHYLNDMQDWLAGLHDLNPDMIEETETKKKEYKLDLFGTVLPAIDRKDKSFYGKLTPEEQSSISMWLLMRWMTSASSDSDQPYYLLSINDIVNNNFSSLSSRKTQGKIGHEELQWMLFTMCGTRKNPRRKFISPPKGAVKNKLEEAVLSFFPLLRDHELELFFKLNCNEELEQFFKDNGYDDKTIKEILTNKGK